MGVAAGRGDADGLACGATPACAGDTAAGGATPEAVGAGMEVATPSGTPTEAEGSGAGAAVATGAVASSFVRSGKVTAGV